MSSSALLTDIAKRSSRAEESEPVLLQQKPRGDPREYQYTVLSNGLQVVNIFDPNSTQAAIAVAVSVGSLSDPEGFDGLAHLTEHAMFLGSKKFPEQSGFDAWLAERGGSSNAWTAEEETVYYVSLNEKAFEDCLERYADIFHEPLFQPSWIWDEVSAVDSEHSKNRKSQEWRIFNLVNYLADARSPVRRFHTGNRKTLQRTSKETLAEEIRSFFASNYCPPRLRLATFAPTSVKSQLEKARKFFERIPRAGRAGRCEAEPASFANPPPFPNSTLRTMLRMQGLATRAEMHLVFPLRSLQPWVRSRPLAYLDHVINFGGPDSLVVALRDQLGLASDVAVSAQDSSAGSRVEIVMSLLPEGVEKLPVALDACFAFLSRALASPKQEKASLLASLAESAQLGYDWAGLSEPSSAVSDMAEAMVHLGPSDLMISGNLILEPDVEKVEYILQRLVPENMILLLVDAEDADFWRTPPADVRTLPHYDARYTARPLQAALPSWRGFELARSPPEPSAQLPLSLGQRIAEVAPGASLGLALPQVIQGLPQISSLFYRAPVASGDDPVAKLWGQPPTRQSASEPETWYREGWILHSPRIITELSLRRPQGQESDKAVDAVTLEVGLRMLGELMDIRLAKVSSTGTSWKVAIGPSGFSLRLSSYASNAASSFEQVLDQVTANDEAKTSAARRLKRVARDFAEELRDQTQAVLKVAVREREILLTPGSHSRAELLEALQGSQLTAPGAASALRAARRGQLSASMLVMGSCSREEAAGLEGTLVRKLDLQTDKVQLIPSNASERVRRVVRPAGPVELRARSPRNDSTHVLLMSILVGTASLRQRVLLGLVSEVLQAVAFAELRTRLQLGYTVGGTISAISNVLTISCYVQSEAALPDLLEAHCEKVLSVDVPLAFESMSPAAFANVKESFRLALLQPPLSPSEEMDRFWAPILLGKCFNVSEQMLEFLKTVEKHHVLAAWRRAAQPKARTKVVLKLFGDSREPGDFSADEAADALRKVGVPSATAQRAKEERKRTTLLRALANSSSRAQLLAMPGAGFYPQTLRCDTVSDGEEEEGEDDEEESEKPSAKLMRRAPEGQASFPT